MIRVKAGPEIKYSYKEGLEIVDLLCFYVFKVTDKPSTPFFDRHYTSEYNDCAIIDRTPITNPKNKQGGVLRWLSK